MTRSETGASLAGLLLVVLVLGVMAAVAVAGTSLLVPGGDGLPSMTLPAGPTTAPPTSGASGQGADIGRARQAACHADYDAVDAADEAMLAQTGFSADSIGQLVATRYLRSAPSTEGGFTIALAYAPAGQGHGRDHGASDGGRDPTGAVTVNGAVGPAACDRL